MKKGWTYKKLGEVCMKITDGSHNPPKGVEKSNNYMLSSQNVQNGYLDMTSVRYLSDENFRIENQRTQAKKGDVLLTIVGTIGRTCVLDGTEGNITFQRSVAILKPSEEINSRFLMFFLLSQNSNLNSTAQGAAQKGIYLKQLGNIELHYPPLSEQHSIVSRLDAVFANIDALKANAEKQLGEARQLFQAELTECMRPKEGWEEKTLPDISENLDSVRKPVTKGKRTAGIYPYYGASGIVDYVDDYLFDEDLLCISEDGANLLMRTYPIAFPISGKVWVNNHAHVLRFNSMTTQKYVEYYFSGMKLDEYITGAAQPKLTQKAMNSIIVNLPSSLEIQHQIVSRLDALSARVKQLEEVQRKTMEECDALKQAMLREVFE
jgi:type I restriction enzyme S subunit